MASEIFVKNLFSLLGSDMKDAKKDVLHESMVAAAKMDQTGKSMQMLSQLSNGEGISDITPVDPSSMIAWNDIVGAEREKRDIERDFLTPLRFPNLFTQGKSLLMYGPPGTGKTYICKGIVSQFESLTGKKVTMFAPTAANIKGGLVGETEQNIRRYFKAAQDAADESGMSTILFMDEVEALAGRRDGKDIHMTSSVNVLLQLLDGVSNEFKDVIFIAATNIPWGLDSAILRRFSSKLFVDLPTDKARRETIYQLLSKRVNCTLKECMSLVDTLTIWSGADKTVNTDTLLQPFLSGTGRETRGGIVGMLGYTLSDLTKVIKSTLNKIGTDKLLQLGKSKNCIIISDPTCPNCDPCDMSDDIRNVMLVTEDIVKHINMFKSSFMEFKATTNIEEYRNYIRYYSNPGGFIPPPTS